MKILFSLLLLLASYCVFPAAHAATISRPMNDSGLVGYWDFGVGKGGTTIYDRSGNSNDGTLTSTAASAAWVDGKIGGGLSLNGSSDYVNVTNDASLQASAGVTISAWVKLTSKNVDQKIVAMQTSNTGYKLGVYSNNKAEIEIRGSGGTKLNRNDSGGATLTTGQWYHIVGVFSDADNFLATYVDGVLDRSTTTSVTLDASGADLKLGRDAINNGFFWHGTVDEVRIYNRALSAGEIERLYKMTGPKLGVTPDVINNGLVGHWTFDGPDMNWSSTTAEALDTSGQGNNSNVFNFGSEGSKPGTDGQALEFDGTDDYVETPVSLSTFSNDLTFSLWVKSYSGTGGTVDGRMLYAASAGGSDRFYLRHTNTGNPTDLVIGLSSWNETESNAIELNKWEQYTVVLSGTTGYFYKNGSLFDTQTSITVDLPTTVLRLARSASANDYFDGSIDDVRLYNRALSADEVARLYNATRPSTQNTSRSPGSLRDGLVAYYSFDGPDMNWSSTTAEVLDTSGNGHSGNATTTMSSSNAVMGKLGQALSFNGVSDYIDLGSDGLIEGDTAASVCAWIYFDPSSVANDHGIVTNWGNPSTGWLMWVDLDASQSHRTSTVSFAVDALAGVGGRVEGSTGLISSQKWMHLCGTFQGGSFIRLYKDGVLDQEQTTSVVSAVVSNTNPLYIGNSNSATSIKYFDGKIDDVRIYNRALSASEVERLYQLGH